MKTNKEFNEELRNRTFNVSIRIVKVTQALPNNRAGWKIGDQVIRSGTAIGALCEEADAGLSYRDFIHGMRMCRKETKETLFWLKLIIACELMPEQRLISLIKEIDEIVSILTSIVKTGEHKLSNAS